MDTDNLYTEKENFLVVLDSRNATSYTNGDLHSSVHFDLNEPIRLPKNAMAMTCSVLQFTCPQSLYNVNCYNNYLHVKKITNDTFSNGTLIVFEIDIYIPVGNYNCNTMLTYLKSVLTIAPYNITCLFDTITNKFTLQHVYTINEEKIFISGNSGSVLGFSDIVISNSGFVYIPYICNFNGLQSFNIHFANLITKNIDSFTKSVSSIIQTIPVNGQDNRIVYIKNSDFSFQITQDIIDDIQIELSDDLTQLLDLNGQHWNLCLYFSIIKDIDRFQNHSSNGFNNIINKFGGF